MKKTVLSITAIAALTIGGVGASAKVKTAKVSPATLKPSSKYLTGKATPSAKVKLSRYGKTFAYGKVTKKGNVKIKLRHKLTGGYTYRVTVAKKGYKTKVKYSYVKPVEVKEPVQVVNSGVVPAVEPSSTTPTTMNVPQTATQTVAPNGVSVDKMQKWFDYQRQLDDLDDQMTIVNNMAANLVDKDSQLEMEADFVEQNTLETLEAKLKVYEDYLANDVPRLSEDIKQKETQGTINNINAMKSSIEKYKEYQADGKTADYFRKLAKDERNQYKYWRTISEGLRKQADAILEKQKALLK